MRNVVVGGLALAVAVGLTVAQPAAGVGVRGERDHARGALVSVYCLGKPPVSKPGRCNFRVPQYSSFKVKNLKWKRWGSKKTSATGTYEITGKKVHIKLSRLALCQVGPPRASKVYTRMTLDDGDNAPYSFGLLGCDGTPVRFAP